MRRTILLALTLLAACTITGDVTREQVRIGFIGPLSGDTATYGRQAKNAVRLAAEDMDERIQVFYEDTQCNGRDATKAVQQLIQVRNVDAIIGGLCSSATVPAYDIAERARTEMITYGAATPVLANGTPYLFRLWPSDGQQVKHGVRLLQDKGHETVAVYHVDDVWGSTSRDRFQQFAKQHNISIAQAVSHGPDETGHRAQLQKLAVSGATAVYLITYPDNAAGILRDAAEQGMDVQFFGTESLVTQTVVEQAGTAANGLIATTPAVSGSERTRNFTRRYERRYGETPWIAAYYAYDAAHLLTEALHNCPEHPERCLADTANYTGVSGTVTFNNNGDALRPFTVQTVQNGSIVNITG